MENLKREFERDMRRDYEEARKLGYKANRFLQMLNKYGGVETAKKLLATDKFIQDGIIKLWKLGRLDLTVEALIDKNKKYEVLFTPPELKIVKKRLKDLKYNVD